MLDLSLTQSFHLSISNDTSKAHTLPCISPPSVHRLAWRMYSTQECDVKSKFWAVAVSEHQYIAMLYLNAVG